MERRVYQIALIAILGVAFISFARAQFPTSFGNSPIYEVPITPTGGTISGPITSNGGSGATGDCVTFDDDGVSGCTRTADEAPNNIALRGQGAWPGATVNTTGGETGVGGGIGRRIYTVANFAVCAGDVMTVTVNTVSNTLTEGVNWNAGASNAAACASLASAITALSGNNFSIAATCSSADVRVSAGGGVWALNLATSDAACTTVTNGPNGALRFGNGSSLAWTINVGTGDMIANGAPNIQFASTNSRIYNTGGVINVGTVAATGHSLATGDVMIGDDMEVDGELWLDGAVINEPNNFAADDTTPDISGGNLFYTVANVGATAITTFDGSTAGQIFTVCGTSAGNSPTMADAGNFKLSAAMTLGVDDCITLVTQTAGTVFIELDRSVN